MIKLILFDLDDTLFKYDEYVRSGFKAVTSYAVEKYGINPEDFFAFLSVLHKKYKEKEIFSHVINYFSLDPSTIIEFISVFRTHKPDIKLFEGYREILENLKTSYNLALLTDGAVEVQNKKIDALKIKNIFNKIFFTEKFPPNKQKPSPFCFTIIAEVFKIRPNEIVYVADNPFLDFIGAKKAGMYTLRVLTGEFKNLVVPSYYDAHYRIEDISHVKYYITEYF